MKEAIEKPGFSFVEVISPCPTVYLRRNKMGDSLAMMKYFHDQAEIQHGIDPKDAGIIMGGKIIVGKFVDVERSPHHEMMEEQLHDVWPHDVITPGFEEEKRASKA